MNRPLREAPLRARWEAAARLVSENRDLLDARVGADLEAGLEGNMGAGWAGGAGGGGGRGGGGGGDAAQALAARGWLSLLLAFDEAQVSKLGIEGHAARWPEGTPSSLVALAERAREVCAMPPSSTSGEASRPGRRLERPRKRAQVDAFARLVLPLAARATRVVDVGAGHGHLTRGIAERIALPVVGLERDANLAERARGLPSSAAPSFAVTDVLREGLSLSAGDCAIGLHACGELGDATVESVARSGASLALVGCCLQKRRAATRRPLCDAHTTGAGESEFATKLDLPRRLLGLSNLTARDDGVEATRTQNLAGRERRLALHRLLSNDGIALRLGAEIEGLNRRAAQGDLPSLVARAFALRGLSPPSAPAIEEAADWARQEYARARRLSLPRALLARVLEVFVLFDRGLHLEERGFAVAVGEAFPVSVSPRNLVLLAAPSRPATTTPTTQPTTR